MGYDHAWTDPGVDDPVLRQNGVKAKPPDHKKDRTSMTSARDTWRFRRSKTLWLRDVLLMVGLGVCAGLSWQIGVQEILAYLQRLGWRFVFVLLPFLLVFICDTFGWRYAYAEPPPVSFLRLLAL